MKKLALAVTLGFAATLLLSAGSYAAAPVPCENALKDLKTALSSAKPSDADKAKIADLQNKGTERCKADDDQGADNYFAQAMKLIGK